MDERDFKRERESELFREKIERRSSVFISKE